MIILRVKDCKIFYRVLNKKIAFKIVLRHNVAVIIRKLVITARFINRANKYDKEREYVRKIVQTQRTQDNR